MQVSDEPGGSRSGIAYVVGDAPIVARLVARVNVRVEEEAVS